MTWLLAQMALAACTFDAEPARLEAALTSAEAAYVALDVPEFQRAMTEVDFMVPCLVEPASPDLAVRLHRIRGLGAFVDGKPDETTAALQAARTLAPDYVFPEEVLPAGFDLRREYEGLDPATVSYTRLPRARRGRLLFDGEEARERPREAATLWQYAPRDGDVVTAYVGPLDPLPDYPGARGPQGLLWASTAATGTTAIVLYGAAWSVQANVAEASDTDDLLARQRRGNTYVGVSSALATAAVGQALVALWLGRRR